jgi:hypothetical protein
MPVGPAGRHGVRVPGRAGDSSPASSASVLQSGGEAWPLRAVARGAGSRRGMMREEFEA